VTRLGPSGEVEKRRAEPTSGGHVGKRRMYRMTEDVGVQRGALYPFDHLPVSQLLSTSNTFGERAFADRPGYALRQGSRCHALKIRSW